jgi:hypothetical protein
MPVITFAEALAQTEDVKRHLLLGNGFSIALFPNRFSYGSLLDSVDFTAYPEAKLAFEALATTDFEIVIQALRQAVTLLPIYGGDAAARTLMERHAEALKELLVQAIAGKHPERPGDVSEEQYRACRRFLAYFAGDTRNRKAQGGKDLRGSLYSLNYDLLLYWVLMHTQITIVNPANPLQWHVEETEEIDHNDGFREPDDEPDAEYVTWDGEAVHGQCVSYLHGALHLYDYGSELQKKCWGRSGGIPLIDQIRSALNENRFPLFVSEGDSSGKFERIRHSAYLAKALREFRGDCDQAKVAFFVFGHSLAVNDTHILKQIQKGKCGHLFVSIYGDPDSATNREIMTRAQMLAAARSERYPLNIQFFDSASANVWGAA